MPQIQYPFIDIAVHPAVRARFAAGEAIALFSRDMTQVLWANGEGARLFGHSDIYDLLDNGPDRASVAFRQLAATARQLENVGDRRGLTMRINAGFVTRAISAEVCLVEIRRGEIVVIFSAPVAANSTFSARINAMLKGFDDPDTHMAVIDDQGAVLAASPGYDALGILPETARTLIAAAASSGDGLVKRPIASAAGYLPAAIGKLSNEPPLHLLFCVETVLGRMDPPQEAITAPVDTASDAVAPAPVVEADMSLPGAAEAPAVAGLEAADEPEAPPGDLNLPTGEVNPLSEIVSEPLISEQAPAEIPPNLELGADQAETASIQEEGEADVAPEDLAEEGDGVATDDREPDMRASAPAMPESLELAADQAETASIQEEGEADVAPEDMAEEGDGVATDDREPDMRASEPAMPESLELAADQAEAASMPEIGEAEFVAEEFAEPDEGIAVDGHEPSVQSSSEPEMPESFELAADLAESGAPPEEQGVAEPEDHVEADIAEIALNDGESDVEVAALAALDGASNEEVEAASSIDEDKSIEFLPHDGPATDTDTDSLPDREAPVLIEQDATTVAGGTAERPDGESLADEPATVLEEPAVETDAPESEAPSAATASPAEDPTPPFEFRRDGRPVRFVWKLDAQGRFAEVSDEFARTVGPHAGAINGAVYRELADRFKLDPDNEIALLLDRRDTWSGRTIRWPVEGTDLVVPVDLAALPTYSRNREFDGFRGFGIIRVADAEQDPHALGLTLGANAAHEDAGSDTGESPDEAPEIPDAGAAEPTDASDEFRGEIPALKMTSNPLGNFSDKIIQLEERRAKGREGLTQSEQAALREIARQLEPFGKRPNEALLDGKDETPEAEATELGLQGKTPVEQAAEPSEAMSAPGDQPRLATDAGDEAASKEHDSVAEIDAEGDIAAEAEDEIGLTASAADQIPLAILIHAGDRLIHANTEFRRFSGYETLDALEASGGLDGLITRHEGADAGVYMIRGDGTHVAVSARLQSVRYEGSRLLMLTLVQADVATPANDPRAEDGETARRLAALKVEAEELRSILETATDGVVVLDGEGRIRSTNRSASALFNFEDSETRGKPFAMLFAHESQKAVQDYLNGLVGHGVASVLNDGREVIGREASGGFIPLFMTMGRMPGSNSYCAVIRDITQWKRSEEELKTAKRAAETANQHKSDFLARVSHEIRTPLNAIIGFSDMIASEHFGPAGHPRYVEYANDIGRSGRHVLDIVNDLLDISKIEAGEMDLDFAAVGINDCVSEAVTLVQPQANAQRVIIRTSLSQSVPDVVADLRSIKQIAINILANAIRFTPSGGQIVVSTAYEPTGSVTLRIRDTGVGMSKTELEQAMKPFGQVSPGARKRGDGTGLGLPLTRAMTEANRAMFSIQSAPNEGTLVEITFPPQRVLAD